MALNLKNERVEALVVEVVRMTGETKTEAVRRALEERRDRLRLGPARLSRAQAIRNVLARHIWPLVPEEEKGRRLSKAEEEAILGIGENGV